MKILFVLELFYPNIGGNERLFLTLGETLVNKGHEVTVVTTKFSKDLPSSESYNGINIIRLPYRSRFAFTFFSAPKIIKYARKADLIHTTSYNAAFPSWIASKFTGKKAIISFHEVWGKLWFRLPYLSLIERILFYTYERFILKLRFNKFIAVSDYTKNCLIKTGIKACNVHRIYNGLNSEEYTMVSANDDERKEFTYTYFGRLGNSKGIDLLLNASEIFLKTDNRRLKIISSDKPGKIYNVVQSWIKKNKLQDKVEFINHLNEKELFRQLSESDCVVIPSYSEGFCYAAAECIARGIPVIVSGKAALAEVVSGKFIKMHEFSSTGLLRALEKAEKSDFVITAVRKFLLDDTVKNYMEVYLELGRSGFSGA